MCVCVCVCVCIRARVNHSLTLHNAQTRNEFPCVILATVLSYLIRTGWREVEFPPNDVSSENGDGDNYGRNQRVPYV